MHKVDGWREAYRVKTGTGTCQFPPRVRVRAQKALLTLTRPGHQRDEGEES